MEEAGSPADVETDAGADSTVTAAERIVAKTGEITVNVTDPLVGAGQVRDLAEARGGWVSWESISLAGSDALDRHALVTITVPADEFDDALEALAALGTLEAREVRTEDVTDQVIDLEARVASKRASIERISALMERTGSVSDIADVERELASRQAELESLLAKQKYLASITDYSTITATLTSPATAAPNPLGSGLREGWAALKASVRVLLVMVGALLPFVMVLGAVGLPVLWALRRRSRRASTASTPVPPSASQQSTPQSGPDQSAGAPETAGEEQRDA